MKISVFLLLLLLHTVKISASDVIVANSGNQEIDTLVQSLVSNTPSPYPESFDFKGNIVLLNVLDSDGYCWSEDVKIAYKKLKVFEPKYFGFFLKHLKDDRYCFSRVCPYLGWTNYTVGEAVEAIIKNEWVSVGGYKARLGHAPPHFSDYVDSKGGLVQWIESVKQKSRNQIDINFILWCIKTEEKRGFENEKSRKVVMDYLNKILDNLKSTQTKSKYMEK